MDKIKKGVRLDHISKIYQDPKTGKDFYAVKDTSLTIEPGSFVTLLGPSGCGKTTTLRMIAGFESPDEGEIYLGDEPINALTPNKRDTAMVFQSYALLPHYNVFDNVAYGLKLRKVPKDEIRERVMHILDLVELTGMEGRMTNQLSGGQQQRVAIARALATNPKVLLCDEATSALDPKTTRQILELIGDINKKLGITVVIITHQMSVVKSVCNHVAILDDGEVVEDGLVSTVFSAPKSAAARHLVFPGGADVTVSDPTQERRIRLIFRSAKTTSIPLVARLATEENIAANVISASTQKLSEEIYGSMLLGVPAAQFDRAWEFLSGIENLQVEEASVGVQ